MPSRSEELPLAVEIQQTEEQVHIWEVSHKVSAVATFRKHAAAEAEAHRLNALAVDPEIRYVVLTSRLKG